MGIELNSSRTFAGDLAKAIPTRGRVLYALSLALLCVLIGSQIFVGKVGYEVYSQDLFVVLDGVLHLRSGYRIHQDFSSIVGIFYLLPYYIASSFAPLSGMTVIYGNALVALLVFGLAVAASLDRLPAIWGAVFSFYVGLLSMSPRLLSANISIWNYENQAFYNRFSWSFIAILCLVLALPRKSKPGERWPDLDAAFSGLLLFVLFYLKITYFVGGIGLLAIAVLTRRDWRFGGVAASVLLGGMVVMQIAGINGPYLADLRHIFAVARPERFKDLLEILSNNYSDFLLVALVAGVSAVVGRAKGSVLPKLILIGAILGVALLLAVYNHKAFEIPLIPVAALIAFLSFAPLGMEAEFGPWLRVLLMTTIALSFAKPITWDIVGLARAERNSLAPDSTADWLKQTPVPDLAFSPKENGLSGKTAKDVQSCCVDNDTEYFYLIDDGMTLLKRHVQPGDAVLSFTWANPFPVLLGLPPVKHAPLWWDQFRTFSAASHPNASDLFDGVKYVMIPKTDMPWAPGKLMSEIYADYLRANYDTVDQSPYWTLLQKR